MPTGRSIPPDWERLRSGPLAYVSAAAVQELAAAGAERTCEPGDLLMRQGEPADGLFVLLEGRAYARLHDGDGAHRIGSFTAGDLVGEMALVTREARSADVVAETRVRALVVPTAAFDRLAARHLDLATLLTGLVADRLGHAALDGFGGKRVEEYTILSSVGRGGMSVVYRAREETTGALVALKMMSYRLIYDAAALSRFHYEAQLLQEFDHPNIARLRRLFPAYHTYFLVMELYDGADLQQLLVRRGPLPETEVRAVLGQLAGALEYVHRRGLIHRDLKPANVLVTGDGDVKLTDFGIAVPAVRPGSTVTVDRALAGTPAFMSPEQLSGEPLDSRSDIYSLGCLAYELLTGRRLFPATSVFRLAQDKARLELPPAEEIGGGISRELHGWLGAALQVDRAARPATLADLVPWAAPCSPPPGELVFGSSPSDSTATIHETRAITRER